MLQPRNIFLKDLGAIPLKCKHQCLPPCPRGLLHEGSLPYRGALLQMVKLLFVTKIRENLLLDKANWQTQMACVLPLAPQNPLLFAKV